jgi:hypothetical protein
MYSLPKASCSALSAGVIDWMSSESSEFNEFNDISSSDNSLRSVSDSESQINELAVSLGAMCAATGTGDGAIAWVLFVDPFPPLSPLFSSQCARRAGWYSIAFAGEPISILGI